MLQYIITISTLNSTTTGTSVIGTTIPKANKGFLRKLSTNENKITIQITGNSGDEVKILSNGKNKADDEIADYTFFKNNPPNQVKLNNESIQYTNGNDYLTIHLSKNGSNTIEIIWDHLLTNLQFMFDHCQDIESIDFSNFDFSEITNMVYSFGYCCKLKYVNFVKGNATKLQNMGSLFEFRISLETMDNFLNTFNVTNLSFLFLECTSLKSIDLSNLATLDTVYINMKYIFYDCKSLEIIDLSNFRFGFIRIDPNNKEQFYGDYGNAFNNCFKLAYINIIKVQCIKNTFIHLPDNVASTIIICATESYHNITGDKTPIMSCNENQFFNVTKRYCDQLIPTTIPSTIQTTIPSTIPTTIPTTIATTSTIPTILTTILCETTFVVSTIPVKTTVLVSTIPVKTTFVESSIPVKTTFVGSTSSNITVQSSSLSPETTIIGSTSSNTTVESLTLLTVKTVIGSTSSNTTVESSILPNEIIIAITSLANKSKTFSPNTTIAGLLSPNNSEAIVPKVCDNETTVIKNPTSEIPSPNSITTDNISPKTTITETLPLKKTVITTSPRNNTTEAWSPKKELTTLLENINIEKIKLETTIIKNTTENIKIPTTQHMKTQLILLSFSSFNYYKINKTASFSIHLVPISGYIYSSKLKFLINIKYKILLRKLQETDTQKLNVIKLYENMRII